MGKSQPQKFNIAHLSTSIVQSRVNNCMYTGLLASPLNSIFVLLYSSGSFAKGMVLLTVGDLFTSINLRQSPTNMPMSQQNVKTKNKNQNALHLESSFR